jgi:hypothetical protein
MVPKLTVCVTSITCTSTVALIEPVSLDTSPQVNELERLSKCQAKKGKCVSTWDKTDNSSLISNKNRPLKIKDLPGLLFCLQ